jgi:hypothetical protein
VRSVRRPRPLRLIEFIPSRGQVELAARAKLPTGGRGALGYLSALPVSLRRGTGRNSGPVWPVGCMGELGRSRSSVELLPVAGIHRPHHLTQLGRTASDTPYFASTSARRMERGYG